MTIDFIPVSSPSLIGNESTYLQQALDSTWISSRGEFIDRVQIEFPKYLGGEYGLMTTSGTTALHLCCLALGIGSGDEVIIPTFTMISSAAAVHFVGAKPVFVDCDSETWTICTKSLEQLITSRTKAIMVVPIYGHPCEMEPVLRLARKYDLKIIEDAAEGIGSEYLGKKVGILGDVSAFSFFANKTLTCGEGGMIVTNDRQIFEKCRYYFNHCFSSDKPREFLHQDVGYNFRPTNLQAAVLAAQIERVESHVSRKIEIAHLYRQSLNGIEGLTLPVEREWAKNSYWMFGILVEHKGASRRDWLASELLKRGVETRPFFIPMHEQPCLSKYRNAQSSLPNSERISRCGIYLPTGLRMSSSDIQRVIKEVRALMSIINF